MCCFQKDAQRKINKKVAFRSLLVVLVYLFILIGFLYFPHFQKTNFWTPLNNWVLQIPAFRGVEPGTLSKIPVMPLTLTLVLGYNTIYTLRISLLQNKDNWKMVFRKRYVIENIVQYTSICILFFCYINECYALAFVVLLSLTGLMFLSILHFFSFTNGIETRLVDQKATEKLNNKREKAA